MDSTTAYKVKIGKPFPFRFPQVECVIDNTIEIEGILDTGSPFAIVCPLSLVEKQNFSGERALIKSKGIIATRYGVNVYSRNKVLQEELDRLGQADFLGGLGVGVATSFVPGVGGLAFTASCTARLLNEAINTTPASELWLQNKNKLLAMDMNGDTVELFLNNPSFSPAQTTVLVTALESMKGVANRGLFIKVALQVQTISLPTHYLQMFQIMTSI